jgi:signal peptidase I
MGATGSIPIRRVGTRARPASPSRARGPSRAIFSAATTAAVLAAAWWLFAPPGLGGATSFVTVDGSSMLPRLERDDLVALRAADGYRVGDVVAYRSPLLGRVVLHRIVSVHRGRLTLKGDHNDFVDPDHPTRADVVGKLWFHVPQGGRLVRAIHVPWVVGTLAALLVIAAGLGGVVVRTEDKPVVRA